MVTDLKDSGGEPRRNFYGRQHGKTLRDRHKQFLANDLAALSPGPVSPHDNPARIPLNLTERFGERPIWLEVGFGGGEHLVHQAASNPDVQIIGCEPFINGVAMLLGKIHDAGVENVAVYPSDVRDLFDVLGDGVLEKVFVLYPDPWPKQRHMRRRFMNTTYLEPLSRVMAVGGEFRVATDIPDYVSRTLEQVPRHGFELISEAGEPWGDWVSTRYERKALREGRVPHYMTFMKR